MGACVPIILPSRFYYLQAVSHSAVQFCTSIYCLEIPLLGTGHVSGGRGSRGKSRKSWYTRCPRQAAACCLGHPLGRLSLERWGKQAEEVAPEVDTASKL